MKRTLRRAFPLFVAGTIWVLGGVYLAWGVGPCVMWGSLLAVAWVGGCAMYDFAEEKA